MAAKTEIIFMIGVADETYQELQRLAPTREAFLCSSDGEMSTVLLDENGQLYEKETGKKVVSIVSLQEEEYNVMKISSASGLRSLSGEDGFPVFNGPSSSIDHAVERIAVLNELEDIFWVPEEFKRSNLNSHLRGRTLVGVLKCYEVLLQKFREGEPGCRPKGFTAALELFRMQFIVNFDHNIYSEVVDYLLKVPSCLERIGGIKKCFASGVSKSFFVDNYYIPKDLLRQNINVGCKKSKMKIFFLFCLALCSAQIVKDGSFEDNLNATSVYWSCNSTVEELKLICSLEDCPGADIYSPGPLTGKYFVWIMGLGYADSHGFVSQYVDSNSGSILRFFIQINTTGENPATLTVFYGKDVVANFSSLDAPKYPKYTIVQSKITGSNRKDLVFQYSSFANTDYNLTHFYIDDVSIL